MDKTLKLTFLADTHYYSPSLGTSGRAYELRSGSDQKCLAETGAIIDAAFEKIANSDTNAVMIAGDLTNDGERICHEEFREKLYKLKEKKPVYVITATHDWCCDNNARRFEGDNFYYDVPVLRHEELKDFYADFGLNQSFSSFTTHLGTVSYAAELDENTVLLALNDDQSGNGGAGFSEEHFCWIENQLKDAKEKGKTVLEMEHHLLIAHIHPFLTGGGTCVKDREYAASRLADAGMRYSFVGHSHIQDIARFTSDKGNSFTEVNIGSICGYPAPIVNVEISGGKVMANVEYLDSFEYNNKPVNADIYLKNHYQSLVDRIVEGIAYGDRKEFADRLSMFEGDRSKTDAFHKKMTRLSTLQPILRPAAKFVDTATVDKARKTINALTFGKGIKKEYAEPYKNRRVLDFVHDIMCNMTDGQRNRHDEGSDYYRLVTSVVALPSKIFKKNKTFGKLRECAEILVKGNPLNEYPKEL